MKKKKKMGLVVEVERPTVAHLSEWQIKVVIPYKRMIGEKLVTLKTKKTVFSTERPALHSWIQIGVF